MLSLVRICSVPDGITGKIQHIGQRNQGFPWLFDIGPPPYCVIDKKCLEQVVCGHQIIIKFSEGDLLSTDIIYYR